VPTLSSGILAAVPDDREVILAPAPMTPASWRRHQRRGRRVAAATRRPRL